MFCMSLSVTCCCTFSTHCWPLQVGHLWSRHWYWMWDTWIWLSYGISQRWRKKNMHSIHGHYRLRELKILFQYGWVYIPNVVQQVRHVRFKSCSVHRTILNTPSEDDSFDPLLWCQWGCKTDLSQTKNSSFWMPTQIYKYGRQVNRPSKDLVPDGTVLQMQIFMNEMGHSEFSSITPMDLSSHFQVKTV